MASVERESTSCTALQCSSPIKFGKSKLIRSTLVAFGLRPPDAGYQARCEWIYPMTRPTVFECRANSHFHRSGFSCPIAPWSHRLWFSISIQTLFDIFALYCLNTSTIGGEGGSLSSKKKFDQKRNFVSFCFWFRGCCWRSPYEAPSCSRCWIFEYVCILKRRANRAEPPVISCTPAKGDEQLRHLRTSKLAFAGGLFHWIGASRI